MDYPDTLLADTLRRARTIAVIGVSANPVRPSHVVARYLALRGYRVIPVNPGLAGQTLFGETAWPSLAAIPCPVDMVDIFRAPEAVPAIVEEALARDPLPQTIWMQIGVVHEAAAARAEAAGIRVIMDRCPKIEDQRLSGELRRGGLAGGIISSPR